MLAILEDSEYCIGKLILFFSMSTKISATKLQKVKAYIMVEIESRFDVYLLTYSGEYLCHSTCVYFAFRIATSRKATGFLALF